MSGRAQERLLVGCTTGIVHACSQLYGWAVALAGPKLLWWIVSFPLFALVPESYSKVSFWPLLAANTICWISAALLIAELRWLRHGMRDAGRRTVEQPPTERRRD